jgi:hypothetical protein
MISLLINYDHSYFTCWDIYNNYVLKNKKINWEELGKYYYLIYYFNFYITIFSILIYYFYFNIMLNIRQF